MKQKLFKLAITEINNIYYVFEKGKGNDKFIAQFEDETFLDLFLKGFKFIKTCEDYNLYKRT
jgi:hypothetical protein